jgi:hypothetical protein
VSRGSRLWRVAAAGAFALLAAGLAVAVPGTIEHYDGALRLGERPGWSRACLGRAPRDDRALIHRCSRVEGRVLYVRREPGDAHVAVIARLRLFVVKLAPESVPPLGSTIAVVGPLVRAANGLREVQAFAVTRT